MNRRGMLRSAAAGVALTVLHRAAAKSGDPRQPPVTVIYDERHADARAFAEHLQRQGATTFATRGDASGLWYGGAPLRNGGAIAGLTTWSDFVIARSCAREFGLRLRTSGRPGQLIAWLLIPRTAGLVADQADE
jgi:hypothetical protein